MGTNRQLLCIRSTKDCRYVPLLITAGLYTVGCLRVKEIVVTERMDRSVLGENIRDASCRYACLLYASYKVGPPPPDVTIRWDSRVYEGGRTLDAVRRFNTFLLAEQNRIELQDAKVNQDILSGGIPELPGYRSVLYERPAQQVTGDVRLIQFVRPGHVVIAVGDVSEKGTGAALRGVELMTLLKTCASQNMTPAQVCTSVDSKIRWDDGAKYATLFYAELELSTGVLTFCNAGQQSFPLLLHSRDHIEKLDCNARPIGLLTDSIYSQATVTMERGDRLLIHTDGVIELHNSEGEEFGIKRLEEIVRDSMGMAASGLKDAIMVAIDEFNQQSFEDDITLLIIDRL
jgi:serine phosphatase RsbU (regulator of sigma subunit)